MQGKNDPAVPCKVEKGYARIEKRRRVVSDVLTRWYQFRELWRGVRSVVMIGATSPTPDFDCRG
jgi:hypothetical protein